MTSELSTDQIIPFEILQMGDKIQEINLEDIDEENSEIKLEETNFSLCSKLTMFCANVAKGPLY